jgi:hypothetical protein
MNQEQYQSFKDKYTNFDDNFVHEIPLEQVQLSNKKSQVRTNGTNARHHAMLKGQILDTGFNHTPVSVVQIAPEQFEIVAGVHRFKTLSELAVEDQNGDFSTIRVAYGFPELNFSNHEEKVIFQVNENTPSAQLECDDDDIVNAMIGLIRDDFVLGSDISQITPKAIRKYLREKIKNLIPYRCRTISKKVMKGLPAGQRKFRNYANKTEAAEKFSKINPWGIEVDKSGKSDMGYTVYFAESITAISQNNVHGVFNLKRQRGDKKVLIVAYCGNVLSKTPNIASWRRSAIAKVDELNNADFLKEEFKFIDGIVFLPQTLLGEEEECQSTLLNPTDFIPIGSSK